MFVLSYSVWIRMGQWEPDFDFLKGNIGVYGPQ